MDIASNDTSPWNSPATGEITAVWKVSTVDSQGKGTGSIWVNSETGKITKTELKTVTAPNNTANQTANATTNATNETTSGTSNNNTWIIIGIIIVVIVIGAGYWMYSRR